MLKFQPSFNDGILLQEKGETVNGFMPSKSVDTGWTDLCFISRWKGERNHTWESYEASWDRRLLEPSVIDENVSWISLFIGDWCTSSRQAGKISHHFIKNGWTFSNHFLRLNSGSIVSESLADFFSWNIPCGNVFENCPRSFFFPPFEIVIQKLVGFSKFPCWPQTLIIINGQAEELLTFIQQIVNMPNTDRWWRYNKEHEHHGISVKEQLQERFVIPAPEEKQWYGSHCCKKLFISLSNHMINYISYPMKVGCG